MMDLFLTDSFSLYKINGLERCGLLVDYDYVFVICLDSYSDGTHSLQRIYWRASNVPLNFSKPFDETNYVEWTEGEKMSNTFSVLCKLFLEFTK